MKPTPKLFTHQSQSLKLLSGIPRGLDTSDPGTGKTRVQIELFAQRRRAGGGAALVLAPKSLLRSAWFNDFASFAPDMAVSVAYASNREAAFMQPADVYVTNIDAVKWLTSKPIAWWKQHNFETLIIDEITAFKHRTSQRSKAMNKIKVRFKYRYGLTGTLNSNSITDAWHPVFLIDDGQRLGTSFWQFRGAVCQPEQVGPRPNMIKWHDKPGAELTVASLIKDITVRHKFEDCVDIPENFLGTKKFQLGRASRKIYDQMEEHAIAEVRAGKLIEAVNAAVVTNKLLQIASGAVYDQNGEYSVIDTARYELVADLVDERRHSVVFFNWAHQRDEIVKEFTSRGITYVLLDGGTSDTKREEAVDLFQKGFYRVFLAHPASAGHGLTLTRGTSTIWASPTYNLEHFLQANRRIYRIGQQFKTETLVVIGENTIDELVYQRLANKEIKLQEMLTCLISKNSSGGEKK